VSESPVKWATSVPILVFLGLSVLDLGPMYATDIRQTSDAHHRLMPPPYGGRVIITGSAKTARRGVKSRIDARNSASYLHFQFQSRSLLLLFCSQILNSEPEMCGSQNFQSPDLDVRSAVIRYIGFAVSAHAQCVPETRGNQSIGDDTACTQHSVINKTRRVRPPNGGRNETNSW